VNDIVAVRSHQLSQKRGALPADAVRRDGVNVEAFIECPVLEFAAVEGEKLDDMAARLQAVKRQEDLILSAAPVRAGIYVDGGDGHLNGPGRRMPEFSIAGAGQPPQNPKRVSLSKTAVD